MPASIGVNLRVTGHCRQGGRKYMEDFFSVAYQQTEDERDLEYAFFGIYDGHGGAEAAAFAKEHLMETIVKQKNFWSDNDIDVLRAIKDGYIGTHYAMWKEQEKWPKTASGLPSTAGTTASVAFIRRGKIYIGHVGDSGIILGYQEPGCPEWKAKPLTKEHKPESALEMSRIESCGGKVVLKSGVPRVVWNRPRIGHQGPVRRSTPIDEIPFLAVARSLGDLWSYNSQLDEFVVSPDPDCSVIPIDTSTFRCLIFGTDGLYNMLSPQMAVHIVQQAERHNENAALSDDPNKVGWLNPSKCLVEKALERWSTTKMRADNTSVVTLMLDPPGPPRAQVLKNKKKNNAYPDSGLKIVTRYEDNDGKTSKDFEEKEKEVEKVPEEDEVPNVCQKITRNNNRDEELQQQTQKNVEDKETENVEEVKTLTVENDIFFKSTTNLNDIDLDFTEKTRESLSYEVRKPSTSDSEDLSSCCSSSSIDHEVSKSTKSSENIQIHEISSSSNDNFEIEEETVNSQTKSESYTIKTHRTNKVETRISTNQKTKSKNNKSPKKEESQSENDSKNGQGPSRPPQEKPVPKSNIRDSLRSTTSAKLKENAWLRGRKRRLINTNSSNDEIRQIAPRKRMRANSSLPAVAKKKQQPKVKTMTDVETRRKYPKLKAPVLKVTKSKKKLLSVNKVVLRQKIRALQRIMTSRVSSLPSAIIIEKSKSHINFNNNNNDNKVSEKKSTKTDKQDIIKKRKAFKKVPSTNMSFSSVKAVTRSHSDLQQQQHQQQLDKERKRPEKVKNITKTISKVNKNGAISKKTQQKHATKAADCKLGHKTTRSSDGNRNSVLRRSSRKLATLERTTQRCNCC